MAKRDENRVTTLQAALNTDGVTAVNVRVDTNHVLQALDGTTGSDFGRLPAVRDANRIPVWLGISSAGDGTLVELYADVSGNLLIQST